ncbi:MAG: MoxR family ATPase, partial [Peptostreptococcus sp.]|nr:MoxR family ATPase [Peptostreptococcus sp.]
SKTVDLRGLFASIDIMKKGLDIKEALNMGLVNKTFDIYEKEIVTDIINSLFEDKLESKDIFVG